MRQLVVTVMLVIAVIAIYTSTYSGTGGTREQVGRIGGSFNQTIESIDP